MENVRHTITGVDNTIPTDISGNTVDLGVTNDSLQYLKDFLEYYGKENKQLLEGLGGVIFGFLQKFANIEVMKPGEVKYNMASLLRETFGSYINSYMSEYTTGFIVSNNNLGKNVSALRKEIKKIENNLTSGKLSDKEYIEQDNLLKKLTLKLFDAEETVNKALNPYDSLREELVNFYVDSLDKYENEIPANVFNSFISELNIKYANKFCNRRKEKIDFNEYLSKIAFPNLDELAYYNKILNSDEIFGKENKNFVIDIACLTKFAQMLPNNIEGALGVRIKQVKASNNEFIQALGKQQEKLMKDILKMIENMNKTLNKKKEKEQLFNNIENNELHDFDEMDF